MFSKNFLLPSLDISWSFSNATKHKNAVLVMAGGRQPEAVWLQDLAASYPDIVRYAADKGAKYFLENKIVPQYVLGDADSGGKALFEDAKQLGAQVVTFPVEKDDTDLQIVLSKLPQADVIISGVWGGRFDHLYSNIFSLMAARQTHLGGVVMADDREVMLLMEAQEAVNIIIKPEVQVKAISLIPLSETTKVSLQGVHWPLQAAELSMYHPYAISNVSDADKHISCQCLSGYVGLYFSLV